MYWTDWSTVLKVDADGEEHSGKIERADMDGNNREVFRSHNLQWPNGLSIDYYDKMLYWCDSYLHRIERISLDGSKHEVSVLFLFY